MKPEGKPGNQKFNSCSSLEVEGAQLVQPAAAMLQTHLHSFPWWGISSGFHGWRKPLVPWVSNQQLQEVPEPQGERLQGYPLSRSLRSPSANSPGLMEPFRGRSYPCASPSHLEVHKHMWFSCPPSLAHISLQMLPFLSSPWSGQLSHSLYPCTRLAPIPQAPPLPSSTLLFLHHLLHYRLCSLCQYVRHVTFFQVSDQPCYSLSFSLCWQSQGHFINEIHQYHKSTTFVYQDGQLQLTSHLVLLKSASCLCLISHRLSLSLNQINQSATRYFLRISGILLERRLPSRGAMRSLSVSVPTLMKVANQCDLTQLGAFKEQCPGMSPR